MKLKMTVDGKKLTVDPDKLNLGEAYRMKSEFGLQALGDLSVWDPEQLLGFATIAVQRANPDMAPEDARRKAETVDMTPIFEDILSQIRAEEEKVQADAADPPVAGANASSAPASGNGSPQKTPKRRGARSSRASTA